MPGITLIFNDKSTKKLEKEYRKINKKVGKNILSIKKDLKPHITLMYFQKEKGKKNLEKINNAISKIAKKYKSYKLIVNGLAIFIRGDNYILYFTTPYNNVLQNIHNDVWKELGNINTYSNHYSPLQFTPHITIPIFKSNKTNTFKIMSELSKIKFDFELDVSALAYLTGNLNTPEVYFKKKL